jgi:hypothetical protein
VVVTDNQLDVADLLNQAREDFVAILGWRQTCARVSLLKRKEGKNC